MAENVKPDCECHVDGACPFAFNDISEQVQNLGCPPSPHEIINMRVNHGKTWACHPDTSRPCVGAIECLKEQGLPHKVLDKVFITEQSDWSSIVN